MITAGGRDFDRLEYLLQDYVESGRLAGVVAKVLTADGTVYCHVGGCQDLETASPMRRDSIFRIYSMTKPLVSVAAMTLWEEGRFDLDDPVSKYLPSFKTATVLQPDGKLRLARRKMTVRHLLTHSAGMTLPAYAEDPLVKLYRDYGLDGLRSQGTLASVVDRLGSMPLLYEPGTGWSYSMASEVVGRLVEIWSGQPLDHYLQDRIFGPLDMSSTFFQVPPALQSSLTTNYRVEHGRIGLPIDSAAGSAWLSPPGFLSGGGGLLSCADDYLRFMRMLVDGGRPILKPETVALMTRNHLPGDMAAAGAGNFNGTDWNGVGFGLGFSVVLEDGHAGIDGSAGSSVGPAPRELPFSSIRIVALQRCC